MTAEAYDLKALISQEHRRAELERLDAGWDGCGCADCQAFYSEIDLEKYGGRVIDTGGTIVVKAARTGVAQTGVWGCADPVDNIPGDDVLSPSIITQDGDSGVSKIKDDTFIDPPSDQAQESGIMKQRGRPRKFGQVSRTTAWRREKEKAVQGTLI